MPTQGTLICFVYTSEALLPLQNATVAITQRQENGQVQLLAVRTTDQSGKTEPIRIDAPPASDSQSDEPGTPFAVVDITVDFFGYEKIVVEDVQVFSGVTTLQNLALIPLSELPDAKNRGEIFRVPSQNL